MERPEQLARTRRGNAVSRLFRRFRGKNFFDRIAGNDPKTMAHVEEILTYAMAVVSLYDQTPRGEPINKLDFLERATLANSEGFDQYNETRKLLEDQLENAIKRGEIIQTLDLIRLSPEAFKAAHVSKLISDHAISEHSNAQT